MSRSSSAARVRAARPTLSRAGSTASPPGGATRRSRSSTSPTSTCRSSTRRFRPRWASMRSRTPRPGRRRSRPSMRSCSSRPSTTIRRRARSRTRSISVPRMERQGRRLRRLRLGRRSARGRAAAAGHGRDQGRRRPRPGRAVAVHRFREFHRRSSRSRHQEAAVERDAQRPHPMGPGAAGDAARKQRARNGL